MRSISKENKEIFSYIFIKKSQQCIDKCPIEWGEIQYYCRVVEHLQIKKKFFNKSSKATDRFLIETVHLVLLGVGYSLSATSLTCVATLSSWTRTASRSSLLSTSMSTWVTARRDTWWGLAWIKHISPKYCPFSNVSMTSGGSSSVTTSIWKEMY